MRVSIKLNADAAAALQGQAPESKSTRALRKTTGVKLEPMHPGVDDDELRTYFYADVDDDRVDEVVDRLREQDGVEAAYVKPPESLP